MCRNVQTGRASVAPVDSPDESCHLVDGVLGVSASFSIVAPVGVGDRGTTHLALRGVTPNPAGQKLQVSVAAGIYLTRLTQQGRSLTTRASVVR